MAVEKLEAWLLAVAGTRCSEELRRPEETLEGAGIEAKDTAGMVALVERHGLGAIPEDARSLRKWRDRARSALGEEAG